LYGTDPNKKDTNGDGVPDGAEIAQKKTSTEPADQNLTQTDKFSRELFSTMATLNQSGQIDQSTIDQLSTSLSNKVQNAPVRKVYTIADLKTTPSSSTSTLTAYNNSLNGALKKYTTKATVPEILSRFTSDGENVHSEVLLELDPIISQTQTVIAALLKITTPEKLATAHLGVINAFERVLENITDIRNFDTDILPVIGAINKYPENATQLVSALQNLKNTLKAL
jgi:hypothetical protein